MMAIAATGLRGIRREEAGRLWAWLACWVLLPNAGFWLMWIVGAPPRLSEIVATGVTGLVVRSQRYSVKFAAFLLVLAYSVLAYIAGMFNLAIGSLLSSIEFMVEMRPASSIEYLFLGLGLVFTIVAATRLLRSRTDFTELWAVLTAVAVVVAAAGLDYAMSFGTRGAYKRSAPHGALFASAVAQSGFASHADGKRNLVLIMVESMGLPNDPAVRELLVSRWKRPDIAARYALTQGSTPYFGSTTSGEIRELCARWGDYGDLVERRDDACLPAKLHAAGYRTSAIHSFDGSFFDRDRWYPNIGFERATFRDPLIAAGAAKCPGVFPGACDRDVPAILARQLREGGKPQFVYWLTVNSHLPVPTDAALDTRRCPRAAFPAVAEFEMICRQFQLWQQLDDRLAAAITRDDFPATDILIVGDHMPPYFDRRQRTAFDPERVPWILLRRRS
ncbi:sulfatase-like hydrolase/transferase [Sphingomonas sp. S2-65]|uniref:sulfatase-like hydrolase/transferase n=1 Tax=Sphingomonas sp. S2-65 TaxID=2903960 RepID=UPI001F356900|nr:sulfatase-like hydrolase/transferase [Sphingomonas sp. S2-65]UYY57757.1 sulfatase-like hydrolase/transferase [Sphingomonas sp. S2-65]